MGKNKTILHTKKSDMVPDNPAVITPTFDTVREFERQIAAFFGAPAACAIDSCTHGIELCLRYNKAKYIRCATRTYLSVPMLASKLNIGLLWREMYWQDYYSVHHSGIEDAAVYWQKDGYWPGHFMCISFQHQKHLSLGRGGMILCPDETSATALRKMAYDGREPGVPWREQGDIEQAGFHYYMTPDTAAMGLAKLPAAIATPPRQWTVSDWPDISNYSCFK